MIASRLVDCVPFPAAAFTNATLGSGFLSAVLWATRPIYILHRPYAPWSEARARSPPEA